MKRKVFNSNNGYPRGYNLYYQCKICGDMICSDPKRNIGCKCGNVFIDKDAGRFSVKAAQKIELYEDE